MSEICEICEENEMELDYNAVILVEGKYRMLQINVCLECFGKYPSDRDLIHAFAEKIREK